MSIPLLDHAEVYTGPIPVHRCPPAGESVMPCCGLTPFEVPRGDRMTGDPALVTCTGRMGA